MRLMQQSLLWNSIEALPSPQFRKEGGGKREMERKHIWKCNYSLKPSPYPAFQESPPPPRPREGISGYSIFLQRDDSIREASSSELTRPERRFGGTCIFKPLDVNKGGCNPENPTQSPICSAGLCAFHKQNYPTPGPRSNGL